jgi:hypothetical protein
VHEPLLELKELISRLLRINNLAVGYQEVGSQETFKIMDEIYKLSLLPEEIYDLVK